MPLPYLHPSPLFVKTKHPPAGIIKSRHFLGIATQEATTNRRYLTTPKIILIQSRQRSFLLHFKCL
jgi:hypothetical protein